MRRDQDHQDQEKIFINHNKVQYKVHHKFQKQFFFKDGGRSHVWTEKKLTTLTEKIITRALDEQQKNLFNIISGNY